MQMLFLPIMVKAAVPVLAVETKQMAAPSTYLEEILKKQKEAMILPVSVVETVNLMVEQSQSVVELSMQ